jgi:hypothetical protein
MSGEDPPVWGCWNEPDEPWIEEEERLTGFLIQLCLFEATIASPYEASASWLDGAKVKKVLDRFQPLPLGAWRWPGYPTRFCATDDVLAIASPWKEGGFSLYIGSRKRKSLAFLEDVIDENWDMVNF